MPTPINPATGNPMPPTINVGASSQGLNPNDPQVKLDAAKEQLKNGQSRLMSLKAKKAYLKRPDPKNKRAVAQYKAAVASLDREIKKVSASIALLGKQVPDLQ